jgi:hypothetical protein
MVDTTHKPGEIGVDCWKYPHVVWCDKSPSATSLFEVWVWITALKADLQVYQLETDSPMIIMTGMFTKRYFAWEVHVPQDDYFTKMTMKLCTPQHTAVSMSCCVCCTGRSWDTPTPRGSERLLTVVTALRMARSRRAALDESGWRKLADLATKALRNSLCHMV